MEYCQDCGAKCNTCCDCRDKGWPLTPRGDETGCEYECRHGMTCGECVHLNKYYFSCSGCEKVVCEYHSAALDSNNLCILCRVEQEKVCLFPNCDEKNFNCVGRTCDECNAWVCYTHEKALQEIGENRFCDECCLKI